MVSVKQGHEKWPWQQRKKLKKRLLNNSRTKKWSRKCACKMQSKGKERLNKTPSNKRRTSPSKKRRTSKKLQKRNIMRLLQ